MFAANIMSSGPSTPVLRWSDVVWLSGYDTNFADESSYARSITVTGATRSTTVKKFGAASLSASGGNHLVSTTPIDLSTRDFTIEAWIYHTVTTSIIPISGYYGTYSFFQINAGNVGEVRCSIDGLYPSSAAGVVSTNTWNHCALTRTGGQLRLFVNGVLQATAAITTKTVNVYSIGKYYRYEAPYTGLEFSGYIDEVRVIDGVAVYTSNFSVPTAAFPRS